MTVHQLSEYLGLDVICMPDPDRKVTGGYACDLLSWVMGRAEAGDAWVTIMSNVNIVAVATLADPACIVLAENVEPDPQTVSRAQEQGVNLLKAKANTFTVCARIAELL